MERRLDERSNELNIFTTQRHETDLKRDLAILHSFRDRKPLPNQPFILRRFRFIYPEDTWLRLHQSGTLQYLDAHEMTGVAYRYFNQDQFASRVTESIENLGHAGSALRTENDTPQTSLEQSILDGHFLDNLVDGHFTMDEGAEPYSAVLLLCASRRVRITNANPWPASVAPASMAAYGIPIKSLR